MPDQRMSPDDPNYGLIDRINQADAEAAGIKRADYWRLIKAGMCDDDKRVSLGYLKEYSRNIGMEPPVRTQVQHDLGPSFADRTSEVLERLGAVSARIRQAKQNQVPSLGAVTQDELKQVQLKHTQSLADGNRGETCK